MPVHHICFDYPPQQQQALMNLPITQLIPAFCQIMRVRQLYEPPLRDVTQCSLVHCTGVISSAYGSMALLTRVSINEPGYTASQWCSLHPVRHQ